MDNIEELIKAGESETLEFKRSTSLIREGIESLVAFANQRGGQVIFGIADDGTVIGQQVSDDTLKNLANAIKLNTDPKLYPSIKKLMIEGKECIVVTIEESPLKPHLALGRAFLRLGPTNQVLNRDQYELLIRQQKNGYEFDDQINRDARMDDIDESSVHEFLETANAVRNLNESMFLSTDMILQKLGLIRDNALTNAAILLFGKSPEKYFAGHYEVKCGRFNEDHGYAEIMDENEFNTGLIQAVKLTQGYLLQALHKQYRKNGGQGAEKLEYSPLVIRESIVNMLVHRDYRQGIKSTIEIRPSAISFFNPATLFGPTITPETLKRRHPSRPGNKLIAKIFYLMGLFENWGSGTLQIIDGAIAAGKVEPDFVYQDGMFQLILHR